MAAIATFSSLKSYIYDFLLRDTNDAFFNTTRIERVIALAEDYLSSNLRVREMRKDATISIAGGSNNGTLPSDFIDVYGVYIDINSNLTSLEYASPGVFANKGLYQATGTPDKFYIDADEIIVGALPTTNVSIKLDYYAAIPALSDSQTTNDILVRYSDLYLAACLMVANKMLKDTEQEIKYLQDTQGLLAKYNKMDSKGTRATGNRAVAGGYLG